MSREDVKGQRGVFLEQKGLQASHSTEAAEVSEESWRARPTRGQSGDPDRAAGRAPAGGSSPSHGGECRTPGEAPSESITTMGIILRQNATSLPPPGTVITPQQLLHVRHALRRGPTVRWSRKCGSGAHRLNHLQRTPWSKPLLPTCSQEEYHTKPG